VPTSPRVRLDPYDPGHIAERYSLFTIIGLVPSFTRHL
jgi:hypothetical protein